MGGVSLGAMLASLYRIDHIKVANGPEDNKKIFLDCRERIQLRKAFRKTPEETNSVTELKCKPLDDDAASVQKHRIYTVQSA
ncbi:hypothetical protein T4E_9314 [Trichinella pseudospiralis]|uniref:Uncharacterized protein n=1 Tax=Trichinella pseudospiralis TaxID=6337 RepID=A0A0V0YL46_TRIPS|nr:hypothetical protein T4E_9314 [Trichinella pseudospiralis]